MEIPNCKHPNPKLCHALGFHVHGNTWKIWNSKTEKARKYKRLWIRNAKFPPPANPLQPESPVTRRALPCVRETDEIFEFSTCNTCDREQKHVRGCEIRERCTRGPNNGEVKSCISCKNYQDKHFYIFPDYPDPLPVGTNPKEVQPYIDAYKKILRNPPKYPGGSGAGIITIGEGPYWAGAATSCIMARELGCKLPIELWYRGTSGKIWPDQLKGYDITLIDRDKYIKRFKDSRLPFNSPGKGTWEGKMYSIQHTKLQKVLYLDADAYVVRDPTKYIESCPSFGYWIDLDGYDKKTHWKNYWPEGDNGVRQVQGGQFFIDREKAWTLIALTKWGNEHSNHFYDMSLCGYSDQCLMRVGLAAGACPGFQNFGQVRWETKAEVCDMDGEPLIVHRVACKMFTPDYYNFLPREKDYHRIFGDLNSRCE